MGFQRPDDDLLEGDVPGAKRALARRRRRRRLRQATVGTVLLAAVVGLLGGVGAGARVLLEEVRENTNLFRVRRVDVGRTSLIPPWEVADLTGITPGQDILEISEDAVARRVEQDPRVLRAEVKRTWARTVRVDVAERVPVAVWLGQDLLEISEDGMVLGTAPARPEADWPTSGQGRLARGLALPILSGFQSGELRAGDVIRNPGARQALVFLARLWAYKQNGEEWLSEVWAGEPGNLVAVTLDGGIPVRIGDGTLTRRKIRAIRSVIGRLQEDGMPPGLVDARFRHQVIVKTG